MDDPVGATAVHGIGGIWGVVAVGLFAEAVPLGTTNEHSGVFIGGGWYLFGVQLLAAVSLTIWGLASTFILLFLVSKISPLRMDEHEELLGADFSEHNMEPITCGCHDNKEVSKRESAPKTISNIFDEIAKKRERGVQRQGEDNFGYEGRFTLRSIEPRAVTSLKQGNRPHESI